MKKETKEAVAAIIGNGYKCYVNLATEEVYTADSIDLDKQQSSDYKEFVPLEGPVTFGIMQDYIQSVEDFEKQSELLESVSFDSPFKNFKTKVYGIGLADEWIAYRTECIVDTLT